MAYNAHRARRKHRASVRHGKKRGGGGGEVGGELATCSSKDTPTKIPKVTISPSARARRQNRSCAEMASAVVVSSRIGGMRSLRRTWAIHHVHAMRVPTLSRAPLAVMQHATTRRRGIYRCAQPYACSGPRSERRAGVRAMLGGRGFNECCIVLHAARCEPNRTDCRAGGWKTKRRAGTSSTSARPTPAPHTSARTAR